MGVCVCVCVCVWFCSYKTWYVIELKYYLKDFHGFLYQHNVNTGNPRLLVTYYQRLYVVCDGFDSGQQIHIN